MSHDRARNAGGCFVLRIEDIDGTRSRPEHVAAIMADLAWLGLRWDGPVVHQSHRLPVYRERLHQLQALNLLYPCFCTRADIAASIAAPHAGSADQRYPGTCRAIDPARRAERCHREPHAWRLDVARASALAGPLHWIDDRAGRVMADPLSLGDVVLARKDALVSYHLAVTIDDAAQGVTDVVRGDDLFVATHMHRLLQALMGLPTPRYHHHPLVTDRLGKRLAKRDGAPMLSAMRLRGDHGAAVAQMLRDGRLPIGIAMITP